jgi:flavin-dependent dehydrogenase
MCGGVISETLVQNLASEGVRLPANIVQRGIDSYRLHTNVGNVTITAPNAERRIAAIFRGSGPRDNQNTSWGSFDGYLLSAAQRKGARHKRVRVDEVRFVDGFPEISGRGSEAQRYDLLVVAAGINTSLLKHLQGGPMDFKPPRAAKTYIREYYFGAETIQKYLGNTFHVFLLNIARLEFAAIVPKGDYATVCLLGDRMDADLIETFIASPEVQACMPPGWEAGQISCQCSPRINVAKPSQLFGDRLVFIGDSGVTRLYKDGIGAAYRAAKAAAATAVFQGVSAEDFRKHFWPACRGMEFDNQIGRVIFLITSLIQRYPFAHQALLKMIADEQVHHGYPLQMSTVMWDTFTGSAPYSDIFLRTLQPSFLYRFVRDLLVSLWLLIARREHMNKEGRPWNQEI